MHRTRWHPHPVPHHSRGSMHCGKLMNMKTVTLLFEWKCAAVGIKYQWFQIPNYVTNHSMTMTLTMSHIHSHNYDNYHHKSQVSVSVSLSQSHFSTYSYSLWVWDWAANSVNGSLLSFVNWPQWNIVFRIPKSRVSRRLVLPEESHRACAVAAIWFDFKIISQNSCS